MIQKKCVTKIMRDIETRQARCDSNKALTFGRSGIEDSFDPQMVNFSRMMNESRDRSSDTTIERCWVKVNIFKPVRSEEIKSVLGKMHNHSQDDIVAEATDIMSGSRRMYIDRHLLYTNW